MTLGKDKTAYQADQLLLDEPDNLRLGFLYGSFAGRLNGQV